MQEYHRLGMHLRLKRVESSLHQKTLGILRGGPTQALISWWESGRYIHAGRPLFVPCQGTSYNPPVKKKMKTDYESRVQEICTIGNSTFFVKLP
jgi:hypothetical protein